MIHSADRQRYYETLKGQPKALKQLIIESLDNALNNALKIAKPAEQAPVVAPPPAATRGGKVSPSRREPRHASR